VQGGCCAGW